MQQDLPSHYLFQMHVPDRYLTVTNLVTSETFRLGHSDSAQALISDNVGDGGKQTFICAQLQGVLRRRAPESIFRSSWSGGRG